MLKTESFRVKPSKEVLSNIFKYLKNIDCTPTPSIKKEIKNFFENESIGTIRLVINHDVGEDVGNEKNLYIFKNKKVGRFTLPLERLEDNLVINMVNDSIRELVINKNNVQAKDFKSISTSRWTISSGSYFAGFPTCQVVSNYNMA
ncbi:MAG: hypothetical protein N4A44_00695 [Alphaproteobacteria bacterium]|jgi:hypothetical protein|nr:hypothetical protein [Alphaproteobacteria bacterium]